MAHRSQPSWDHPLKILLFASNTPPDIAQVDNEILILREQFQRIAREFQIELEVTAVPSHEADYLTWLNLLGSNQYHIIHYAGHCSRDEASAADFIYLREEAGNSGRVLAMTADDLLKRLSNKLWLFYLNTCHCTRPQTAMRPNSYFHFAEAILAAGARSVIGNSARMDDRFSAEFARDFYWQLFSNQFNLANAMQMTRLKWAQQTRFQESGHLFWLAPVLWLN